MTPLLVDNQLPVALVRFLHANGWESIHVQDVGLETADDRSIWQYALERNLTIVTKDEDFLSLCVRCCFPPKVICLLIGYVRIAVIADCLLCNAKEIE